MGRDGRVAWLVAVAVLWLSATTAQAAAEWTGPYDLGPGMPVSTAIDDHGHMLMLWDAATGAGPRPLTVRWWRRGTVDDELTLANVNTASLVMNGSGRAALVSVEPASGGSCAIAVAAFCSGLVRVRIRPAGGKFGPPVTLGTDGLYAAPTMGADGTLLVTWLTLRQSESGSNAAVLGPQPGALWRIQQLAHHAGFNDGPVSSVAPDGTAAVAWRETDSQGAPLPTPLRIAAPGQDFQTPLYAGGSDPPAALLADRGGGIDLLLASAHTVTEWTRTPGGSTSPRMLISGDSGAARFIAGVRGQVLRVLRRTAYSADFHELLSERGADGAFSAPRTAYGSTLSIALAPDVDGTTLAALSPLTGELTISVGSIPRDGTLGPTQLVAPAGNTPSVLVSESGTAIISYFVSTERPDRSYDTVARFLRRDPPYVDTAPPVATVSSPALVSPAAQTVVLAVSCNEPCRAKPEYGARTSWHSAKVTYRVRANLATRQRRALRAGKPITVRLQISDRAGNTRRLAQRVRPRPPAHRPG